MLTIKTQQPKQDLIQAQHTRNNRCQQINSEVEVQMSKTNKLRNTVIYTPTIILPMKAIYLNQKNQEHL